MSKRAVCAVGLNGGAQRMRVRQSEGPPGAATDMRGVI